jgi:hypothetical protein
MTEDSGQTSIYNACESVTIENQTGNGTAQGGSLLLFHHSNRIAGKKKTQYWFRELKVFNIYRRKRLL